MKENNKLIAEFMGIYPLQYIHYSPSICRTNGNYHKSWDWLMPVVEKIENECLPDGDFVTIEYLTCYVTITQAEMDIVSHCDSKIEAVYYTVVEFIKWYNENNSN